VAKEFPGKDQSMPTVIGIIFTFLGVYCLLKRRDFLLGLLIFAGIFQASSVINIGSTGVQPYYLIACLFIYSQIRDGGLREMSTDFTGKKPLYAFCVLGVLSALFLPFVFAGMPVYGRGLTIDEGFYYRIPLHFMVASNLVQAGCLTVNVLVVSLAASGSRTSATRSFYNLSFGFLIAVIIGQSAGSLVGVNVPNSIFRNNPGYAMSDEAGLSIAERVSGTYSEPSGAGAALVIFYAGCFAEFIYGKGPALKVILAALAICLVRSSSSLVAAGLTSALILVFYPPIRSFFFIRKSRLFKFSGVVAAVALLFLSPVGAVLSQYTTEKNQTLSYVHRLAADYFALQLTGATYGLGVGLGSNRPSSFATCLLSEVGIIGAILFLIAAIQISRNAQGTDIALRWSLFGILFCKCLGGPDITDPQMWIMLALATNCASRFRVGGSFGQRVRQGGTKGGPVGAKTELACGI